MTSTKLIFFALCLVLLIPTASLAAKLYKWVDKDGVVHVTDDPETVPKDHRSSVKEWTTENKPGKSLAKVKELWRQIGPKGYPIGIGFAGLVIILLAYNLLLYTRPKFEERKRAKRLRALELSGIDKMNTVEFSNCIGRLLEHRGFKVETPEGDLNLGIDLVGEKDKSRYALQLRLQMSPVSRRVLNEIDRDKHRYGCNRAMIITNTHVTEDATEFAKSIGCELIGRDILADWITDFDKKRR